ncbi:TetR-like C-terminal domain-containing protein [Kitasatospora sp. NPDC093102]|uniref:TetR-like C-terminal domain-containing protein n=1 Tax=Kitasatospora sp. NPDC093102 TaxID=3155069 RepID=UPI003432A823
MTRGELPPDTDPMLLTDLLAGAAWLRIVFHQLPLDEHYATRAVDTVLTGAAPAVRTGGPSAS